MSSVSPDSNPQRANQPSGLRGFSQRGDSRHAGEMPGSGKFENVSRLDAWLDRMTDFLNPILVKEARQSLKSRQFLGTFSLLLIAAWVWSIMGVALRTPEIYYAADGPFMLVGYGLIMLVPLFVIIPFSAFRSLVAEREDGTYDLLSISTLGPRQIILGKLGSSVIQMMVYLSVLLPCMTFTYLLRGVGIILILEVCLIAVLVSLFLCSFGLLLSTIATERYQQVAVSVVFMMGLAFVTFWGSVFLGGVVMNEVPTPFGRTEFWTAQAAFMAVWACLTTLCLMAAAARITFLSENRSTSLRIAMLVTHFVIFTICGFYALCYDEEAPIYIFSAVMIIFWWFFGTMVVGENGLLPLRVRRGLPRTQLGKMFFSALHPGPAAGYAYVVTMAWMIVISTYALNMMITRNRNHVVAAAWAGAAYITFYLGLSRLFLSALQKGRRSGPALGLAVGFVFFAFGCAAPLAIQYSLISRWRAATSYTWLQLPNPLWTLSEMFDGRSPMGTFLIGPGKGSVVLLLLTVAAAFVYLLNLWVQSSAPLPESALVPERVREDSEVVLEKKSTPPTRTSPWDDEAE